MSGARLGRALRRSALIALAAGGGGCAGERADPPAPAERPAAPTPNGPWIRPSVPPDARIEGISGMRAADCAPCHAEIVAEWRTSTHAAAWRDPQFQQELAKDPGVAYLCVNCHTPAAAQQAQLHQPTALLRSPIVEANPAYDPEFQAEGVSCMSCHYRAGGRIAAAHADVRAPHPTVYAPELREVGTCTVCHQAVTQVEDTLVCTFNTGAEWEEAAPGKGCPACHMPEIDRSHAIGAPVRRGGRHTFPGSLIPKKAAYTDEERAIIGEWAPGASLTGERIDGALRLQLSNANAGHKLPTGDPERQLYLRLVRIDSGAVLWEERIGQTWTWWPRAERTADNRLARGETRTYTVPLPGGSPDGLRVQLDHERISEENAKLHGLDDYARARTVLTLDAAALPAGAP